jgi:hypothetical protein
MAGRPHELEDANVPTRNVRDAQAEHRFKSIRTHQRCVPRVTCTPIMTHDDSTENAQRIEETDQVTGRIQRRVQGCIRRS